jgi:cyclic beta-1,2-glucan synthetase
LLIWIERPQSLVAALPILILWAGSKLIALWLNDLPIESMRQIKPRDLCMLRRSALHIWRYFAEFSNEDQNWLVPDNVEDEPRKLAVAVSPTNVGLLLNARQVANEFGYLTVPEFVDLTEKTLDTITRLQKYRGHLLNWYATRTLEAKPPFFVSSVDSGNLVASLWTLHQGCQDLLHRPLISKALADGLLDHLQSLVNLRALPKRTFSRYAKEFHDKESRDEDWLTSILNFPEDVIYPQDSAPESTVAPDVEWLRKQAQLRVEAIRKLVQAYMPWELAEFSSIRKELASVEFSDVHINVDSKIHNVQLQQLPGFIAKLEEHFDSAQQPVRNGDGVAIERLRPMLANARRSALHLIEDLRQASERARNLANATDFTFLLDKERMMLSIGFDIQSEELQPYFYNLLATEPRTAVFIAIAKEDVPEDCWFRLDRPFTSDHGRPLLLSWTGTMFEYLMPSIWMRSYPNTLLDVANIAAVRTQQAYGSQKNIPWGISESACAKRNEAGDYHYEAFGVPKLALRKSSSDPLVVSPYSTFLALNVDREGALSNLRRMDAMGWFGPYGFYEAADYSSSRSLRGARYEIVKSWMVHHQGMSLLSLANLLCDNVVQRWFHADRRVQATELLLQEKPFSSIPSV